MNELLIEKEKYVSLKNKYEKKIFEIENYLIRIEQNMNKLNEHTLINSLSLSNDQQKIVDATDNHILVIACPGAGKTHTLISRYINLVLNQNINPDSIILITFTKKAGQEMQHRLENIIPNKLPFHVGSLHGLSYRILQKYNNINYTILDEKETNYLLLEETDKLINNTDEDLLYIRSKIVSIVDSASSNYPINFKEILKKLNLSKYNTFINNIYKNFCKRKRSENAIDFNDLMIQFCDFLKTNKSNDLKNKIKNIFFDEYQDINPIQNYILSMFKDTSNIMVVGDDSQSIYSFRGSSVKYIHNFANDFLPNSKYFLIENYRSSEHIVNFCEEIIKKNIIQFNKQVKSVKNELGVRPTIHNFKTQKDLTGQEVQYKWVIHDIKRKVSEGIKLNSIVILARTNRSLSNIELELISNKIPVVKQLGTAILDKYHVKDFLAFVIITYNPKSSIHWKRIISLHKNFNIALAEKIIGNTNNIYQTIVESCEKYLELNNLIRFCNSISGIIYDMDKAKYILSYLEELWSYKHSCVDDFKQDILMLLYYLRNTSLINFITELYLNQEVLSESNNYIYLSTIHGAKGLEWEHVYIIDVNNNDFPNVQTQYYKNEIENMEEERRLFYVACSRSKKYLTITYHTDIKTTMSPFIRELNEELYVGNNVIKNEIILENSIPKNITNIIRNIGYSNFIYLFNDLNIKEKCIHESFDIPKDILKLKNKYVIGNFIDILIPKILKNNFSDKMNKFDLNVIYKFDNFPKYLYSEYIDENNHWSNILTKIFNISIFNTDTKYNNYYKDFLTHSSDFYYKLEQGLIKLVNTYKPKNIINHLNINYDNLKGEVDLLFDDILIEIKVSSYEICNVNYLCQTFAYAYLLTKKNIKINKIILYNVQLGTIYIIDTTNFNFDLFYNKLMNY